MLISLTITMDLHLDDTSGILHGEQPSSINDSSYQDSKYGDVDDYIAFTAEAPGDSWFTGKVPAFYVDTLTGAARLHRR
ncbi:MAG: hypothetical protein R3C05_17275 [Pirellulaceae bacterium]